MIIDSHVNLHAHQFDEDRDAVIARAREAGVGLMVEISDKLSTFDATHALAMAHADIWATVGVHPHEAKDHADLTAERLVELAGRSAVRSAWSLASCGWTPTVAQMSAWAMARAWVASKVESLSEISTIRPTPASRARAMTASRSSSNWGA